MIFLEAVEIFSNIEAPMVFVKLRFSDPSFHFPGICHLAPLTSPEKVSLCSGGHKTEGNCFVKKTKARATRIILSFLKNDTRVSPRRVTVGDNFNTCVYSQATHQRRARKNPRPPRLFKRASSAFFSSARRALGRQGFLVKTKHESR